MPLPLQHYLDAAGPEDYQYSPPPSQTATTSEGVGESQGLVPPPTQTATTSEGAEGSSPARVTEEVGGLKHYIVGGGGGNFETKCTGLIPAQYVPPAV